MGTQAQLDALKSEYWNKSGTYTKVKSEYDKMLVAKEYLSDLNAEFMGYRLSVINTMDSYNTDGNEWVGLFYNEMDKSSVYVDTCYRKFEAVYNNFNTLLSDYETRVWDLKSELGRLKSQIDNFVVDEEVL